MNKICNVAVFFLLLTIPVTAQNSHTKPKELTAQEIATKSLKTFYQTYEVYRKDYIHTECQEDTTLDYKTGEVKRVLNICFEVLESRGKTWKRAIPDGEIAGRGAFQSVPDYLKITESIFDNFTFTLASVKEVEVNGVKRQYYIIDFKAKADFPEKEFYDKGLKRSAGSVEVWTDDLTVKAANAKLVLLEGEKLEAEIPVPFIGEMHIADVLLANASGTSMVIDGQVTIQSTQIEYKYKMPTALGVVAGIFKKIEKRAHHNIVTRFTNYRRMTTEEKSALIRSVKGQPIYDPLKDHEPHKLSQQNLLKKVP